MVTFYYNVQAKNVTKQKLKNCKQYEIKKNRTKSAKLTDLRLRITSIRASNFYGLTALCVEKMPGADHVGVNISHIMCCRDSNHCSDRDVLFD